MENTIYFTYRKMYTNRGNSYTPSYYNSLMFSDYEGITEMIDGDIFIPESKITKINPNSKKSNTRLGVLKFINGINRAELEADTLTCLSSFLGKIKTTEDARQWIRDNTSCEEVEEGKFLIENAHTDRLTGEEREAEYLEII